MEGTDKFITVNGVKLHYVVHGDPSRPPFNCLHGISPQLRSRLSRDEAQV